MKRYLDRLWIAFWVTVALLGLAAVDFPLIGAWARTLLVLTAILLGSLVGTVGAAATTAAALPAIVLSAVTVSVGVASAAIAYRALPKVVEVAKEHPWESVSPAVAAVAYFPGDVLAKTAGLQTPNAEAAAAVNTLVIFGAGVLMKQPGIPLKVLASVVLLLIPAALAAHVVVTQPFDDAVRQLTSALPALAIVLVVGGASIALALFTTRPDAPKASA